MKWLDSLIEGAVKKEVSPLSLKVLEDVKVRLDDIHNSQRKFQQEVCKEVNDRLKVIEDSIKPQLNTLVDSVEQRLAICEGNLDDKITGLYKSFDERISQGNGNGRAFVGVMKRLAQLEDVKDAVEHRRTSQELIQRRDELKKMLVDAHREGHDISSMQIELNTILWVMGNEVVNNE
jgi:hypothetical protein